MKIGKTFVGEGGRNDRRTSGTDGCADLVLPGGFFRDSGAQECLGVVQMGRPKLQCFFRGRRRSGHSEARYVHRAAWIPGGTGDEEVPSAGGSPWKSSERACSAAASPQLPRLPHEKPMSACAAVSQSCSSLTSVNLAKDALIGSVSAPWQTERTASNSMSRRTRKMSATSWAEKRRTLALRPVSRSRNPSAMRRCTATRAVGLATPNFSATWLSLTCAPAG